VYQRQQHTGFAQAGHAERGTTRSVPPAASWPSLSSVCHTMLIGVASLRAPSSEWSTLKLRECAVAALVLSAIAVVDSHDWYFRFSIG